MLFKKDEKSPDEFWREYETQTGEKVLARGLGKYVSGWDEFDKKQWSDLWGLVIDTSGGFRFHHFPRNSIFDLLTQFAAKDTPKEETIFIPKEKITSLHFIKEPKWWKRIFVHSVPLLVINYIDESGGEEKKLIFEAEYTHV